MTPSTVALFFSTTLLVAHFLLSTSSEGNLTYSVLQAGQVRLEPARVGVLVGDKDLGAGVELGQPQTRSVSEVFLWRGNKSHGPTSARSPRFSCIP